TVVQELAVAVEERPGESEARGEEPEERERIAMDRAPCIQRARALGADKPDAPGLHGKRLPPTRPEPDVIHADDRDHPRLERVAAPARRGIAEDEDERKCPDYRERRVDQEIVETAREPPRDRGRPRRGARAHR